MYTQICPHTHTHTHTHTQMRAHTHTHIESPMILQTKSALLVKTQAEYSTVIRFSLFCYLYAFKEPVC